MLNLWYYSEWLISSEVNAILLFVLASFCESAWLTASQHGNNNLERVSCDQFFLSVCFIYSWVNNFGHEGLGLLLEALEKLLDKKQWVTSYICCWVFAQCAFHSIAIHKICLFFFFFPGKSPLINATSINLSSVWRLSWTIRSVWFNRHKAIHTTDHPHKNLFSCRYEVILLWRKRKNLSEYTGLKCSPAEQWIDFTKK